MLEARDHHALETRGSNTVRSCFLYDGDTKVGWARLSTYDYVFRFTSYVDSYRDFEVPHVRLFESPETVVFNNGRVR